MEFSFTETACQIEGREWMIPSTVCMPEGQGPFPYVVMLHGTASSRDEVGNGYKHLAPLLARQGIASVRFDFAGCGESPVDFQNYTMASALQDTSSVIHAMEKLPQIDEKRLGLLGWSQGGMLAVMLAGRNPAVRSMVTWACALKMDFYLAEYREEAIRNGFVTIDPQWRPSLNVSGEWFREALETDAADDLPAYSGDVLAVCGSKDEFGFQQNLPVITGRSCGSRREAYLVEGAGHIFNLQDNDELFVQVLKRTADWFADTL